MDAPCDGQKARLGPQTLIVKGSPSSMRCTIVGAEPSSYMQMPLEPMWRHLAPVGQPPTRHSGRSTGRRIGPAPRTGASRSCRLLLLARRLLIVAVARGRQRGRRWSGRGPGFALTIGKEGSIRMPHSPTSETPRANLMLSHEGPHEFLTNRDARDEDRLAVDAKASRLVVSEPNRSCPRKCRIIILPIGSSFGSSHRSRRPAFANPQCRARSRWCSGRCLSGVSPPRRRGGAGSPSSAP